MTQAVSTAISPSLIDNSFRIQQLQLILLISQLKCLKVFSVKTNISLQLSSSIIHQPWNRVTYRTLPLLIALPQQIIRSSQREIPSLVVVQLTGFQPQKDRSCLSLFVSARRLNSKSVFLKTASDDSKTRSISR